MEEPLSSPQILDKEFSPSQIFSIIVSAQILKGLKLLQQVCKPSNALFQLS